MGKQRKWSRCILVSLMILGILVCDMEVQAASVKLNKTSLALEVGKTAALKLKNTKKGKNVKWKSSNTSLAKVSSKGKITAIAKGTAKITATYMKKKYVCKVVVRNIQKVDPTPDNNKDQTPEPNPDNNPEQTPGKEPGNNPANESTAGEFYDYKIVYEKVVISRIKKIVDKDVIIPETIDGYPVTKLGTGIFEDCEELNSVKLPEGITEIPEEAFSGCKDLTQIIFEGKITAIGSKAFYNCLKLEQLDGDWSKVTNIPEGCFKNCNSLILKELPSELLEIGNQAFYNCDNLGASVLLPKTLLKIGDSAFYDCDSVFSMMLLVDDKQNAVLESIGEYAFSHCDKLSGIDTNKATKIKSYGEGCFKDCISLSNAELGGSAAKYGTEIFSGCKALNRVNFSYGITSVPARAFYECYNLSEITLPASVTRIESQAFSFAFLESGARRDVRFMVLGEKMDSAPDAFWGALTNRVMLYYFNADIGIWGQNIGFQCIKF